jgi:hypothetical protein
MVSPRLVERGAEYSGPTNQSSGSASFLSMLTHDFPEWKKYWVSNGSLDIPWQDVLTDQNREEIIEIAESNAGTSQALDELLGVLPWGPATHSFSRGSARVSGSETWFDLSRDGAGECPPEDRSR